jgi:hypothetical protein
VSLPDGSSKKVALVKRLTCLVVAANVAALVVIPENKNMNTSNNCKNLDIKK